MTMGENSREFKAGDMVRYVGGARGERVGYVLGYETVIAEHGDGRLQVADKDGDLRVFFDWEWQHASNSPPQAPQATPTLLTSTEAPGSLRSAARAVGGHSRRYWEGRGEVTDAQEIVWGPAIAVDGKRPGWIADDVQCRAQDRFRKWYGGGNGVNQPAEDWHWPTVSAISLPADHPHYRQPAPIDWSGELEAVHEDGRVVPVKLFSGPDNDGDYAVRPAPDGMNSCFRPDGSKWVGRFFRADTGWRIRNVTPQPTPQADTKPDVTALREKIMEAARVVTEGRGNWGHDRSYRDGASAMYTVILAQLDALLPETVDPEYGRAEKLLTELWYEEDRFGSIVKFAAEQVARGRELALAGEKAK